MSPRRTRLDWGDSRKESNMKNTRTLTGVAVFTAIVVVLQLLCFFIRFGIFEITLVLVPIVVGAALYGPLAGGWLGLVFGLVVLLSGDAGLFFGWNPLGTILTVLLKGTLAGVCAGLIYRALAKWKSDIAAIAAGIAAPVVNTGIFFLGCLAFFLNDISVMAAENGQPDAIRFIIFGFIGGNFIFELLLSVVLSPVVVRLIKLGRKDKA